MKLRLALISAALLALPTTVFATTDNIDFTTFVPDAPISTTTGSGATIAFTYAGNKFVGSTYFDNVLYQTSLTGTVSAFGTYPVSGGSVGELVLGASLGQSGFTNGNVFAGSQAGGQIYQFANAGGTATLFATVASGGVRQIFFDPGSTFGGNMLVTTNTGYVYEINSAGTVTQLAYIGEDTEGMDIAPSSFGPYAGDLMVASEGSGDLRFITPAGVVVATVTGLGEAETVSTVPANLDPTNPLQGFYVANYAQDIQFAAASNFTSQGLGGSVIVTSESGGSEAVDLTYNGSTFVTTPFTFTGDQISQFEDGIFVTPQRIIDTGPPPSGAPEPSSIVLLGTGLLGLGGAIKRKFRS